MKAKLLWSLVVVFVCGCDILDNQSTSRPVTTTSVTQGPSPPPDTSGQKTDTGSDWARAEARRQAERDRQRALERQRERERQAEIERQKMLAEQKMVVSGSVMDFIDVPIPGAAVRAYPSGKPSVSTTTSTDGSFQISNLPREKMEIRVNKLNYVDDPTITNVLGAGPFETVRVELFNNNPQDATNYATRIAAKIDRKAPADASKKPAYYSQQWERMTRARVRTDIMKNVAREFKLKNSPALKVPAIQKMQVDQGVRPITPIKRPGG